MASTPGGASHRLLTMKFMQRAAAAKSPTTPSTQANKSDDDRPSKRRRTQDRASPGGLETPGFVVDQNTAQAALEEEDRKRQAAIDRMAERLGDAHWVLDTAKLPSSHNQAAPLKVVQVGFSEIDKRQKSEVGHDEEEKARSFQSYGPKKKMTKEQVQSGKDSESDSNSDNEPDSDSDSDSDNSSDSADSDSSSEEFDEEVSQSKPGRTSYGSQKRDEIRSRRNAAQEKARKMAADRRNKEVNLHKLTSISGGGVGSFSTPSSKPGPRR